MALLLLLAAGVTVVVVRGEPTPPDRPRTSTAALAPAETRTQGGSLFLRFETGGLGEGRLRSAQLRLAGADASATTAYRTASVWDTPGARGASVPALDVAAGVAAQQPGTTVSGAPARVPLPDLTGHVLGPDVSFRLATAAGAATGAAPDVSRPRLVVDVVTAPAADPAERPVYAHYFPPYPISYDNRPPEDDYYARNLLAVGGEDGRHAAYGGLLRDRPAGRAPLAEDDFLLADLRTEVRQAQRAGLDGFTLDLLSTSGQNWVASLNLMRAAQQVGGLEVVPTVDATAPFGAAPPEEVAARLAELYAFTSAGRDGGALRLASFAAERQAPTWWAQVQQVLLDSYGIRTSFVAVFLDASEANMAAFAPVSTGFGAWGERTAAAVEAAPDLAARARALGRTWMAPVAIQDARPRSGLYAEAGNTETMRAMWARARADGADQVQVVTWNDYSESTSIAPSRAHAEVFTDLTAFYASWFRRGTAPRIGRDRVVLTHRVHAVDALPTSGGIPMSPTLGGATTAPRDTVEALVMLRSPASVEIRTGAGATRRTLSAGVHALTAPLAPGTVSAVVDRDGRTVVEVRSPHQVTATPVVQDLQYWAASGEGRLTG